MMKYAAFFSLLALPFCPLLFGQSNPLSAASYEAMARHIVRSLRPAKGERVILRYDPKTLPEIEVVTRRLFQETGADVRSLPYGPAPGFEQELNRTDIYVWLPAGPDAATPADQANLLAGWLDSGRGRQVHFHWGDGTRNADGLGGEHTSAYDRVYLDALDIDYDALDRAMELAIEKLRSGEVRVTTPAGTDIRFRVGDRPFCKQNGDASKARMATARVRIDREIELPAGALRVAPVEDSVNGVMVIPAARIGASEARGIRLEFEKGLLTRASAASSEPELMRYLDSGPGLKLFREFAIGFNPRLLTPPGERYVAYYGYGAGAVRLGLGDNSELGGNARGFPIRWLFFMDATVRAGGDRLVEGGRLVFRQ
jgi:hypothetical protein